ncbi:unnamed protein product, partial [Laminaria digitata]
PSVVTQAVAKLLGGCKKQGGVLGLDCEWGPSLGGAPPKPVSTLQLSLPDGTAYCFQLLQDPSIIKVRVNIAPVATAHLQVGINVNLDASFLARDYGVKVANTVDVRTHARECWVETPSRSLAGMVFSLLGKELPKDPTIWLSQWSSDLQPAQVQYACLDAFASVLVYLEIEILKDPIR